MDPDCRRRGGVARPHHRFHRLGGDCTATLVLGQEQRRSARKPRGQGIELRLEILSDTRRRDGDYRDYWNVLIHYNNHYGLLK